MATPGEQPALTMLRAACVPGGILASTEDRANYRRIWTRDAVVCGLAGVAVGDELVIGALDRSLSHLLESIGPHGELPSNVSAERDGSVSYGSIAGRIDAGAWFAIGAHHLPERDRFAEAVRGAFELYDRWELNARGLVYSPLGGGWADEYPLSGYTLTEQLLRLWALRLWGHATSAAALQSLLEDNFWIGPPTASAEHYHPVAYRRAAQAGPCSHFVAALSPAGYTLRFDAMANALAILLGVGSREQQLSAARAGLAAADAAGAGLVPAFWPPIARDDPQFGALESLCTHQFRNQPGHYHNGGRWPMVGGFFAAALRCLGDVETADDMAAAIASANRLSRDGASDNFYEYHAAGGGPDGVRQCSWSAAGELLASASLSELTFGAGR